MALLGVCCTVTMGLPATAHAESTHSVSALSSKQQSIIPIAAFTAKGDTEKLKGALAEGLQNGMTVNEIKEVLVQMYAYTGFPRSLTGLNTFIAMLDERKAQGIEDEMGRDAPRCPTMQTFANSVRRIRPLSSAGPPVGESMNSHLSSTPF